MTKKHAKTLSLFELMQQYPNEEDAIKYFEHNRWGNEPVARSADARGVSPSRRIAEKVTGAEIAVVFLIPLPTRL